MDDPLPPARIGPYILLEVLGRGVMGVVHRARHHLLEREAAVKLLQTRDFVPDALHRFQREAELMGRSTHPNVVRVFDTGIEADRAYIAMEFIDGRSLADVTRTSGMMSLERSLSVVAQIGQGLAALHGQHSNSFPPVAWRCR